jgi:hypothetical protein
MTALWMIGSSKFALDVSGFLDVSLGGEAYELRGYHRRRRRSTA